MITLTDSAAEHVLAYLKRRGHGIGIRILVKTTGCSGLMYVVEVIDVDSINDDDDDLQVVNGVRVVIDPKTLVYVDGTVIDYVKESLNEGFAFKNPNVKAECGCGESFTV